MRSNILQEVKLSKVIFHAKKAAGGTPYPSLAAGKLQIQWEVRDVRKQRSVAKKKNIQRLSLAISILIRNLFGIYPAKETAMTGCLLS